MNKKHIATATALAKAVKVGNRVLSQNIKITNKQLLDELQNIDIDSKDDTFVTKSFLVTKTSIKDYNYEDIGIVLMAENINGSQQGEESHDKFYIVYSLILLGSILLMLALSIVSMKQSKRNQNV